jgi:hypothetical protein
MSEEFRAKSRAPDPTDVSFHREIGGCFRKALTAARGRELPIARMSAFKTELGAAFKSADGR